MDIRNLSKIKHIYRVSVDKNFDVHIVKFPVVYINKNWLYYKTERSGELSQIRTGYVRWASEFIEKGLVLSDGSTVVFFDVPDELISYIKSKAQEESRKWSERMPYLDLNFAHTYLRQYRSKMVEVFGDKANARMKEDMERLLCELNLKSVLNNNTN